MRGCSSGRLKRAASVAQRRFPPSRTMTDLCQGISDGAASLQYWTVSPCRNAHCPVRHECDPGWRKTAKALSSSGVLPLFPWFAQGSDSGSKRRKCRHWHGPGLASHGAAQFPKRISKGLIDEPRLRWALRSRVRRIDPKPGARRGKTRSQANKVWFRRFSKHPGRATPTATATGPGGRCNAVRSGDAARPPGSWIACEPTAAMPPCRSVRLPGWNPVRPAKRLRRTCRAAPTGWLPGRCALGTPARMSGGRIRAPMSSVPTCASRRLRTKLQGILDMSSQVLVIQGKLLLQCCGGVSSKYLIPLNFLAAPYRWKGH